MNGIKVLTSVLKSPLNVSFFVFFFGEWDKGSDICSLHVTLCRKNTRAMICFFENGYIPFMVHRRTLAFLETF